MTLRKYFLLFFILFASTACYSSSGLEELESILERKKHCTEQQTNSETTRNKCSYFSNLAYSAIHNISLATTTIKRNVEYFFPFVSTVHSYLTRHFGSINFALSTTFSIFTNKYKNQFSALENKYNIDFQPNRDPILIHNMIVKFHPRDPHLLDHKESDFMKCITPAEQAAAYGGELISIDTCKISNAGVYNPCILQHKGKLYTTLRVQRDASASLTPCIYESYIFLAEMTKDFEIASYYPLIQDKTKLHEDARLIIFKENFYASYVTVTPHMLGLYSACIEIGQFIPGKQIATPIRPNIDDNTEKNSLQKNWLLFEKDGKLLIINTIDPMIVHDATDDLKNPKKVVEKPKVIKDWHYGPIRSSTAPILIREHNKYLSFFHSDLKTADGIREYFLGALLFDNEFNITHYSKKPLFISTPHTERFLSANTILPFGCIRQGDNLLLSVGINDKMAAIMKIPVSRIIETLNYL